MPFRVFRARPSRFPSTSRAAHLRDLALWLGIASIALTSGCGEGSSDAVPSAAPARIEVVFPDQGSPSGGDKVSIYTTGFASDFEKATPEVHFGKRRAKVAALSSFALEVETPPGFEGPVDIRIDDDHAAQTAVLSSGYSYAPSDPIFDSAGLATLEGAPAALHPGVE